MSLFDVIVGTYEEFLLGFTLESTDPDKPSGKLSKIFASHSHAASIRCVSGCGEIVASGGADDKIFVYSLKTRQEIAILTIQSATVNTLEFSPDGSHLFAGCADGSMLAYSCDNWELAREWKDAHKGSAVTQIRIHPSGKLALTLGTDLTLRTWNLVKGRQAYATNLKSKQELGRIVDCVEWSPDGRHFSLSGKNIVQIWSSEDASVQLTIDCSSRPTCLAWITANILAIGMENGKILLREIDGGLKEKSVEAHEKRVKAISCRNPQFLTSVGSAGDVTAWAVDQKSLGLKKIASTNIGCRPTCVFSTVISEFPAVKRENSAKSQEIIEERDEVEEVVTVDQPSSPKPKEESPETQKLEETIQTPIIRNSKRKSSIFCPPVVSSAKKSKRRSLNPFSSITVTDIEPEDLNLSVGTVEGKKNKLKTKKIQKNALLNKTIN
ncbi:p21-activated protein kinase-interacting protein 1-like [Lutzomyia longipalpis]|uniref:p21-activated protein kinase-interacting protein 1-like n=1 Tax=Lutzomyia longipalpis TaxID=7200 RepID=UPI0024837B3F|nr:p21-activated protein kinase-interacting protein 1-like [Lutzomyia longipalpis]